MIAFRHADPRLPFLHESAAQSPARWHDAGEGPVTCFADTPDGAWAEFLRHEEIRDPADLATIRRALWAVDIGDEAAAAPALSHETMMGGVESYAVCRAEAGRLRAIGPPRDGQTIILFGRRPAIVGWRAAYHGRPADELLARVQHLVEHQP